MKLIIQRVSEARLSVGGELVSEIGKGLFVLLGIGVKDTGEKAEMLADKLSKIRLMSDSALKMNYTVKDVEGEMLIVSQFTLYADTAGGNRPSFLNAARPEVARPIYEKFIEKLKKNGEKVSTGRFGEYMKIEPVLDGPVTIIVQN